MIKIVLRKKIVFLFLFFGLLPLAVTFFLTIAQIQQSLKETANNNLISLSNEVVNSVEKTVRTVYVDVELLSENPLIRSEKVSHEEKLAEIKRIQDFYGIFEDITLIDLDGNVIISTTYKYRGEWKNKQWYQEAKQGKSSISPAHIILGPYKVILSSAAPVRNEQGNIIAVIAGQVDMATIWQTTDKVKVGQKGFVFMVNKEGRFVAFPQKEKILAVAPYIHFKEEIFSKNNGTVNYIDESKVKMLGGFASFSESKLIEQLGWKAIVAQPENEALALIKIFQWQVVIIFLAGVALLSVVGYLLGGRIVVPLKKLIMATKKLALGRLEAKIEIKTGDEIEELAESFNQMAKDMEKSRAALEESKTVLEIRVGARTRELQEMAGRLEEKVKERTKELQERINELERFHRLTVGRELKMIELKKELKRSKGLSRDS